MTTFEIAKIIDQQIKASVEDVWTYFSWGVSKKIYLDYEGMPTLGLRVSGVLHKGWVYISLNEGSNTYEIRLLNTRYALKGEPITDVYNDQLGDIIDQLVERGTCSLEEYGKAAMKDSMKKMTA